jgi:MerR family copper efflux transcriptional regulator
MSTSKLKIGELSGRVGVAKSALRFYESAGLLGPSERTPAGYRIYGPEALGRVQFIQRAKALGLSLDEIRRLVDRQHDDSDAERQALRHVVAHKIAKTRSRIDELKTLELELQSLYTRLHRNATCGHLGDCWCWLPTEEEAKLMADDVVSRGPTPCPECDPTSSD